MLVSLLGEASATGNGFAPANDADRELCSCWSLSGTIGGAGSLVHLSQLKQVDWRTCL